jgi:hypothetical protein
MNDFSITWGVRGPVRVLILTGAQGQPPEDLLDAARESFEDGLNFDVRVKLHPIRYNPSGRFLSRLREEIRHHIHLDRPWWWMVGVTGGGRMPKHWTFLKSRGWKDTSYIQHLVWADVVVYDTTSLAKQAACPVIHWIGRERLWDINPAQGKAVGDPLLLRYKAYQLGRWRAKERGLKTWDRSEGIVLKEYHAI